MPFVSGVRQVIRRVPWLAPRLVALFLGCLVLPATARAEHVTVQLKDGKAFSGELLESVPGSHVLIETGRGTSVRVSAAEILEVQVTGWKGPATQPSEGSSAESTVPASMAPSGAAPSRNAAAVESLLLERRAWETRSTAQAGPAVLTVLGLVSTLAGALLITGEDSSRQAVRNGAIVLLTAGPVVTVAGFTWSYRRSKYRKLRALQRIDHQLRTLGVQARLLPSFSPISMGGGLSTLVRF